MARRKGLLIPTHPSQVVGAARGDYGAAGGAAFLVLYGGVVGLDIFRRGGLENVDRRRFAGYFGGGFAFMLLAWFQPEFATLVLSGVLLIQLLNVAPSLIDWFNASVVGRIADSAAVGSARPGSSFDPPPLGARSPGAGGAYVH